MLPSEYISKIVELRRNLIAATVDLDCAILGIKKRLETNRDSFATASCTLLLSALETLDSSQKDLNNLLDTNLDYD